MTRLSVLLAAPLIALALPTAALAHPKLLSSTPQLRLTDASSIETSQALLSDPSMNRPLRQLRVLTRLIAQLLALPIG